MTVTMLGAPGVSFTSPAPLPTLVGVRRDVAAFVGVATRGPCRLPVEPLPPDVDVGVWLATAPTRRSHPVAVSSWDEYRRVFGGYEGPGRLPYAVSAFFSGGGRLAYVVRMVHDFGDATADAAGRASGRLGDLQTVGNHPLVLTARSEGTWGNRLRATLRFVSRSVAVRDATTAEVHVDRREWIPQGSLLRLTSNDGTRSLHFVDASFERADPAGAGVRRVLDLHVAALQPAVTAEVMTAELDVVDGDPAYPRRDVLTGLGARPDHPRWLARVLVDESSLVWPAAEWTGDAIELTDPSLPAVALVADDAAGETVATMSGGQDRWQHLTPDDFFDDTWVAGDELPGDGVMCLVDHDDVGLLVTPDLYEPQPLGTTDDVTDPPTLCGPDFAVHVDIGPIAPPTPPPPGLDGLRLDPRTPLELQRIVEVQQRLVAEAERRRDLTVLLDVPPGLAHRQILDWRNEFDSAFAAAYHPWLDVAAPDDQRDSLVRINPSAFAAAIIAERELRLGVQHGPANEVAVGAARVAEVVPPPRHDELHRAGIDVFQPERDGIRLTAARTLSRSAELRQLSVARLMTVLRLTLEREMRWAVFEPSNPALWAEIRRLVHDLLSRFFDAGAFRGATAKEAFFVRCDRTTMAAHDLDEGRVVCLVGVAPAEPVEYLLVELALSADGGVRVEAVR